MQPNDDISEPIFLGEVPLGDIAPNDYNPNQMTEVDFIGLCESIKVYGFRGVITLKPNDAPDGPKWRIVDGEQRYKACNHLERGTIPAVAQTLPEAHAKLSTLNMNNLRGTHDPLQEARLLVQISQELPPDQVMRLNGMRPIEFQESMALLNPADEAPLTAKGEDDPPVIVTLSLLPGDSMTFEAAMERAYNVAPTEDTLVLVQHEVTAYDAAMRRAQTLLNVQKRGDAFTRICQFFMAADDETLAQVLGIEPAKEKKKKARAQHS